MGTAEMVTTVTTSLRPIGVRMVKVGFSNTMKGVTFSCISAMRSMHISSVKCSLDLVREMKFKSNVDLAKHLQTNILWENCIEEKNKNRKAPSILVVNKPYGVPLKIQSSTESHEGDMAGVSIEGAMPLLRERLHLDKPLEVLKSPGRFCSGPLLILASKSEE